MPEFVETRFQAVHQVLEEYYDALYHGDAKRLGHVFHSDAHYFTASGPELLHLDMQSYLPIVSQRPAPSASQAAYWMEVDSIEFAGPRTAMARLRCTLLSKDYTDFLTLGYLDGQWQILSKVFHFVDRSTSI